MDGSDGPLHPENGLPEILLSRMIARGSLLNPGLSIVGQILSCPSSIWSLDRCGAVDFRSKMQGIGPEGLNIKPIARARPVSHIPVRACELPVLKTIVRLRSLQQLCKRTYNARCQAAKKELYGGM